MALSAEQVAKEPPPRRLPSLRRHVDCAVGVAPCLTPSETGGFEVDEAEVTFWGACPNCRRLNGKRLRMTLR